ncbi:MAG: DDE-type integrase/transposase/recombinase [Candidatus Desulforudis sp.]|nr:DDE-type integrase/transposase/recombinase [Desulforudis sp.]
MLDADRRCAILTLSHQGRGVRTIARAVGVSRNTVRRVLASGSAAVQEVVRPEQLSSALETIKELYRECEGNRVRVWEELAAKGTAVPYQTLTGFMRRHGIGVEKKERAGSYHFEPGEEMQHDTSPHDVTVGGKKRRLQCAALILCHSRMLFARCYPTFNRFCAKIFLTEALLFMGGAARRCVIDNTSIVIAHGTGKKAVIAPEMEAFAERFGFAFLAHALGDVNRKGRVERPFGFIERNFYPGRTLAEALRQKCGRSAIRAIRHLHRMYLDYPTDAVKKAAAAALCHGLFDTSRIERMVLRTIAGEFFQLPLMPAPGKDGNPFEHGEEEDDGDP